MTPLNCKTHFTLLKGLNTAETISERCKSLGYSSCVIADVNSVSGSLEFSEELSNAGIKPILGCDFNLRVNNTIVNQILIAKTKEGWQNILELISRSHDDENYDTKQCVPSITLKDIEECNNGIISYAGRNLIEIMPENDVINFIDALKNVHSDVFVSVTGEQYDETLRSISNKTGLKTVPAQPSYYSKQEDAYYHRLMLCTEMKQTLSQVEKYIGNNIKIENEEFFKSDWYYIKPENELTYFTPEEIETTDYIASLCDIIPLSNRPSLPHFKCPNDISEAEYLRELCRTGWKQKNKNWGQDYVDRIKHELSVIQSYDVLNTYFLIVQDYIRWAKDQGWLVGCARGCFTPDSRVKMTDGTYRPISFIKNGDHVIDAFGNPQIVTDTMSYLVDEDILELEFENNKIVRCTKDHKFLTRNRGWVEAILLTDDDDIVEIQ